MIKNYLQQLPTEKIYQILHIRDFMNIMKIDLVHQFKLCLNRPNYINL